jgi:hypothetical protein
MAKLTKKMLDALIKETMLQEDIAIDKLKSLISSDFLTSARREFSPESGISLGSKETQDTASVSLAQREEDEDKLDLKDLQYFLQGDNIKDLTTQQQHMLFVLRYVPKQYAKHKANLNTYLDKSIKVHKNQYDAYKKMIKDIWGVDYDPTKTTENDLTHIKAKDKATEIARDKTYTDAKLANEDAKNSLDNYISGINKLIQKADADFETFPTKSTELKKLVSDKDAFESRVKDALNKFKVMYYDVEPTINEATAMTKDDIENAFKDLRDNYSFAGLKQKFDDYQAKNKTFKQFDNIRLAAIGAKARGKTLYGSALINKMNDLKKFIDDAEALKGSFDLDKVRALKPLKYDANNRTGISYTKSQKKSWQAPLKKAIEFFKNYPETSADDLAKKANEVLQKFYTYQREQTQIKDKKPQQQTITSPELKTTQIEEGILPQEYVNVFESLMTGRDLKSRMTSLYELSAQYLDFKKTGNEPTGLTPQKLMRDIVALDVINYVVKDMDSGAGAYYFESLLAVIAGGQATGKLKTSKGQAGPVDFITKDGTLGSAKFYARDAGIEQAGTGFKMLYDDDQFRKNQGITEAKPDLKVEYIVALKKQDELQKGKTQLGTSDPSRIIGLEIYTPSITYTGAWKNGNLDKTEPGTFLIGTSSVDVEYNYEDDTFDKVNLTGQLGDPAGFLTLVQLRTETFKQYFDNIATKLNGNKKKAYDSLNKFYDSLDETRKVSKSYFAAAEQNVMSPDAVDRARQTIGSIDTSKTQYESLLSALGTTLTTPVTENKMKELDLMIENMVKQFIKGKLND